MVMPSVGAREAKPMGPPLSFKKYAVGENVPNITVDHGISNIILVRNTVKGGHRFSKDAYLISSVRQ